MTVTEMASTDRYAIFHHGGKNRDDRTGTKLCICFGPRSSGLEANGFGVDFMQSLGIECVYVAQRKQSMYQGLSFEEFSQVLAPLAEGRQVYTYGSSVGAYAALYFAGAVNAKPIMASPRCPGHPQCAPRRFKHIPFHHVRDLVDLPRTDRTPLILWDPYVGVDSTFTQRWALPVYPQSDCVHVPGGGHLTLRHMKRQGVLSVFMKSVFLEGIVPKTQITDTGSAHSLHMDALKHLRKGDSKTAKDLLHQSISSCSNTHNLSELEKLEAELAPPQKKPNKSTPAEPTTATAKAPKDKRDGAAAGKIAETHAVATCMRNEGQFLLEWVAYQHVIGFGKVIIVTNDCEDGTDALAQRLAELGEVIHVQNRIEPDQSPQITGMKAVFELPEIEGVDWLLHCDADEFLDISLGDGTVSELTKKFPQTDAFAICWHYMGSSGYKDWPKQTVIDNLLLGARGPRSYNCMHKTLFRPEQFGRCIDHMPKDPKTPDVILRNSAGELIPNRNLFHPRHARFREMKDTQYTWENARIRHYAVRSEDVFLLKNVRGDGMSGSSIVSDRYTTTSPFWRKADNNTRRDEAMLRHMGAVSKKLESYLADPELFALDKEAYDWFLRLKEKHIDSLR